jgi:hypothetical protein
MVLALIAPGAPLVAREKSSISYADLSMKYRIIGPLGAELGKVVDLEVEKIKTGTKLDEPTLIVKSVNGKKLKRPVECPYRMLIIGDIFDYGRPYRIRAYQDGAFTGTPREVLKEILFQSTDYYFEVTLVVFKYLD